MNLCSDTRSATADLASAAAMGHVPPKAPVGLFQDHTSDIVTDGQWLSLCMSADNIGSGATKYLAWEVGVATAGYTPKALKAMQLSYSFLDPSTATVAGGRYRVKFFICGLYATFCGLYRDFLNGEIPAGFGTIREIFSNCRSHTDQTWPFIPDFPIVQCDFPWSLLTFTRGLGYEDYYP